MMYAVGPKRWETMSLHCRLLALLSGLLTMGFVGCNPFLSWNWRVYHHDVQDPGLLGRAIGIVGATPTGGENRSRLARTNNQLASPNEKDGGKTSLKLRVGCSGRTTD